MQDYLESKWEWAWEWAWVWAWAWVWVTVEVCSNLRCLIKVAIGVIIS